MIGSRRTVVSLKARFDGNEAGMTYHSDHGMIQLSVHDEHMDPPRIVPIHLGKSPLLLATIDRPILP